MRPPPNESWSLAAGAGLLLAFVLISGGTVAPAVSSSGPVSSEGAPTSSGTSPTYVILVHGFDPAIDPSSVWTYGVNFYQQLVSAGYVVGIVSYYGTFTLAFSDGTTLTDPSFYGTTNTPIESIGLELGKEIQRAFAGQTGVTLDLMGHSMGGLVTEYMLEHVRFPGITVAHVIYLGSPFNGAPVTAFTPYLNLSGYQASEMSQGSSFLTALHAWVPTARQQNPSTVWIVYAGDASPLWAYTYFKSPNDGLVDVPSASDLPYNHIYLFPNLHVPELDSYDPGVVSYFEDQKVATEILDNFSGHY